MFSLRELKKTGELIAQDYQIMLNTRRLRSRVIFYHDASVLYWLQNKPEYLNEKNKYRQEIFQILEEGPGEGIEADIMENWISLQPKVHQFIKESEAISDVNSFLNPAYMEVYRNIIAKMESLVVVSTSNLKVERERNEAFYKLIMKSSAVVFGIALIVLLSGLNYFRKHIIEPVLSIIEIVDNIRRGDLTEQKAKFFQKDEIGRMTDTVNKMTEELAQRRKERVEFIGAVAHDLRNPLNTISLSCELAQKKWNKMTAEEGQNFFGHITKQIERLTRLTDDLLQAAKENKPIWHINKTTYQLNEQIRSIIEEYQEQKNGHEYRIEGMERDIEILADKQRIGQVLDNLLSNSTKYSPSHGLIVVRLSRLQEMCIVEVADQGTGIPDDRKETVFQPFLRLESNKDMAEGTGLGLAIVRDIVQSHGGAISVYDNVPKGSVFRIELPLVSV